MSPRSSSSDALGQDSSFDISFLSGTSSDLSFDSCLSPKTPEKSRDSVCSPKTTGLGIYGLASGGNPYHGLGILSLHSPTRRDETLSEQSISTTLLEEVLFTFTDDPFHTRALTPIPECEYEAAEEEAGKHSLVPPETKPTEQQSPPRHRLKVLTRNLSTSTMSTMLKQAGRGRKLRSGPVWR